jgi:uncharacterized membrane protein (DUF485 family)
MSWNEIFWWLAILTLSLALAQLGIPSVLPAFYNRIFKHNRRVHEIMRIFPNFLAILSIIALVVAIVAGLELIIGFGDSIAILIARYFGYLDNITLMAITRILVSLIIVGIAFILLRLIWRLAATLPNRNPSMQQDTTSINEEIRQQLKKIKEENTRSKGK